jgi:hypothetical protein
LNLIINRKGGGQPRLFISFPNNKGPQVEEAFMSEQVERGKRFVKIKDGSGNEWLCPLDALKKAKDATQEELDDCVELDVVTHTAGDIDAER